MLPLQNLSTMKLSLCLSDVEFDIVHNANPGIEYELALFYKIKAHLGRDDARIMSLLGSRCDFHKIERIIEYTDISVIFDNLHSRNLSVLDCTLETQNDEVGPADIVLIVRDACENVSYVGVSVKYNNTCTLNVTGRRFITDHQIASLRQEQQSMTAEYIREMNDNFGAIGNWFRKRKSSVVTDKFIDMIRDAVISNWDNVGDKESLFGDLFQASSPIPFWVYEYRAGRVRIITDPFFPKDIPDILPKKYQTSYVGFYLNGNLIAKMQVKFNNGFIEKSKKKNPDIVEQGVKIAYGQPFSSWNFSVVE